MGTEDAEVGRGRIKEGKKGLVHSLDFVNRPWGPGLLSWERKDAFLPQLCSVDCPSLQRCPALPQTNSASLPGAQAWTSSCLLLSPASHWLTTAVMPTHRPQVGGHSQTWTHLSPVSTLGYKCHAHPSLHQGTCQLICIDFLEFFYPSPFRLRNIQQIKSLQERSIFVLSIFWVIWKISQHGF